RVPPDFQIGTASGRLQIGFIGGDAAAVAAVDRIAGNALAIQSVEVGTPRIARCQRGVAQPTVDRAPLLRRRAIDRQRSATAMARAVTKLEIILDDREQRHDLFCRTATATT